jgi:ABC-type glycerol-3-phosphate transport system substrate-binding protein
MPMSFSTFKDYQVVLAAYNDDLVFKGFPASDKSGSCIELYSSLSMSSTCKNKEAAWKFIRQFLIGDYQTQISTRCFPSNMKLYDEIVEDIMKVPEEDELVTYTYGFIASGQDYIDPNGHIWEGQGEKPKEILFVFDEEGNIVSELNYFPINSNQMSRFNALLSNLNYVDVYDTTVDDIVFEEIISYFEGDKNIDDVCNIIQQRVQVYLQEQQ